ITPTFNNTTICVSNCIEIFAPNVGGNYGQIKYNWTPSLTDTASFLFCPTKNSKFIVYASDINNCISNVEEIFVNLYDSLEVEASKDTMICRDFGTNIFATPSGGDGNGFNYKWTPFPGLNNPTIKSPFANPAVTTTYLIELTDNCGSPAVYDSVKITVNPVPNVQFASDGFEGCEKQLIQFFNNSDIGDFCTWHMGDNTIRSTC